MARAYSQNAEYGKYAEAHDEGRLMATFSFWFVNPVVANDKLTPPISVILIATAKVPTESARTQCTLTLYRKSKQPDEPWRKYVGDLRHDESPDEPLRYVLAIKYEEDC